MDDFEERIHRLFDPDEEWGTSRIADDQLVVYNPSKHVSQLQRMNYQRVVKRDDSSVVVHIDGACRDNGKPSAKAAYGVYFGPDSPFNKSGLLDPALPQTSTRAEIEALSQALVCIRDVCANDLRLSSIKIVTDSAFLVSAFTEWMQGWIRQKGKKSNGQPVKYFDELKAIHDKLDDMEYGDDGGIACEFWNVPRGKNGESDALANAALDSS